MENNPLKKLKKNKESIIKPLTINEETHRFIIRKYEKDEIYEIKKSKTSAIIIKLSNFIFETNNKIKKNESHECYGILGKFNSNITDYLITISDAEYIGEILKSKIYQITKVCISNFKI